MDEQKYTIEDLASVVAVPVRTIRFYISEGLIPGPEGRGKGTVYGEEHLQKLRLARRLSEQRVPLAEIRAQVAALTVDEVKSLMSDQDRHEANLAQAAQEGSPKAYVAALLERARSLKEPSFPEKTAAALGPTVAFCLEVAPPPADQTWRRRELAPGVELHVRQDAEVRQKSLIDVLLRVAHKRSGPDR